MPNLSQVAAVLVLASASWVTVAQAANPIPEGWMIMPAMWFTAIVYFTIATMKEPGE